MTPRRTSPRPPAPAPKQPAGKSEQSDLFEEITILRDIIRQVSQRADEFSSPQDTLRLLEAISRSSSRLATLLKTQRLLEGEPDDGTLSDALKEILADMTKNL